jgi:hypothetical protein
MNFAGYAASHLRVEVSSIPGEYENHLLGSHFGSATGAISRKMGAHSQGAGRLIN